MPIKFIGRTTDFKGKPLWEILANLRNFGVGRIVIRNRFQRYPEPCYMKILKVAALPVPGTPYKDRKVMVLVERTFRGYTAPIPIPLESSTYKADYMLVPKDQEHLYLQSNVSVPEKRILPRTTDLPPLFSHIIKQQMRAKGQIVDQESIKMIIKYNESNMMQKNYKLAEGDETPTVELKFSLNKSSSLYPKEEATTSS